MLSSILSPLVWLQVLTGSRIPIAIATAVFLLRESEFASKFWWLSLVGVILVELTDGLDGFLARKHGLTTTFGGMFDPYADAASRFLVFWGLSGSGYCAAYVLPIIVIRDLSVAYIRTWLTMHGLSVGARTSGKIKAVAQGAVAVILTLGPGYWNNSWALVRDTGSAVVGIVVLVSAVDYLTAAVRSTRRG